MTGKTRSETDEEKEKRLVRIYKNEKLSGKQQRERSFKR